MSVIAKLSVSKVTEFGTGRLVELHCVATNDVMAAYAGSEEDKLFTKYSPNGEIKLNQGPDACLGKQGDVFYVMVLHARELSEEKSFAGAYACCPLRVNAVTDYGGNSKRVEMRNVAKGRGVDGLSWNMSIDNPPASDQLKPGCDDYWVAFYPADRFDRDQAIRAAHGYPEPEAA